MAWLAMKCSLAGMKYGLAGNEMAKTSPKATAMKYISFIL
jgi:hypothetical protein